MSYLAKCSLHKLPHIELPQLTPTPGLGPGGLAANLAPVHTCISVCSSQNGKKATASTENNDPNFCCDIAEL